jgi:hypothetical protein
MAIVGSYFTLIVFMWLAFGVFVIFPAVLNTNEGDGTPEWAESACDNDDD